MFRKIIEKYLLVLIILLAFGVLSYGINKPFIGHHDFTNSFTGIAAKNYINYGVFNLKFGQVPGRIVNNEIKSSSFYTHYPPLLSLMVAASFLVFGTYEWAERLVPILFSLIGVVSLFLICQKIWNKKIAFFASLFFILNPMFIYFGKMAVQEPLIVGTSLLAINFYLDWIKKYENKYLIFLILSLFIGGLIGWPIIYLGPLLILHSILVKKFNKKIIIPFFVIFITLLIHFLHTFILTGDIFGGGILSALTSRLAEQNLSFGGSDYNVANYIRQEFSWLQAYYTKTLLFFSALYLLFNLNLRFNSQKALVLILLMFGLGHPILFSRYVFIHDFLNIYLLPFFTISAALGLDIFVSKLKNFKINNQLINIILVCIFILFAFEKLSYTKALHEGAMNANGLKMANVLNQIQTRENQTIIVSPRFGSFFGIFTNFYSKYPYIILDESQFKSANLSKVDYVITIDEDIRDVENYNKMKETYRYERKDDLNVFYIR